MELVSVECSARPLHLFQGFGIELEYMIVNEETLDILPITDQLFHELTGSYQDEVDCGIIGYSNELALHVFEMRNVRPCSKIIGLDTEFQSHIQKVNHTLKKYKAKLLPTGAHPWMDPYKEMKLWPHAHSPVYEAYHRIFDCRGHGWANLQSTHINLPFCSDEEFYQLHAAIRFLLPIMPALSASSPILEQQFTGKLDKRLDVYRFNQKKIPSITAQVIPEISYSKEHYEKEILEKIYKDISPYDPESILQEEWLNARGAIARFDRNAVEIRVLDIQECPLADCAIANAITFVLKEMIKGSYGPFELIKQYPLEPLVSTFFSCVEHADQAIIQDTNYLKLLGVAQQACAADVWESLLSVYLEDVNPQLAPYQHAIQHILCKGTLARRILKACQGSAHKGALQPVYQQLTVCLDKGIQFDP